MEPLAHLQVVDLTTGIAGPYCTKLFADAGAEVVRVLPLGGDPLRRYAATAAVADGEDGALFRYLNAGKQTLGVSAPIDDFLAGADLLVEDLPAGTLDIDAIAQHHPHLVIVSITPFGRTGPLAGAPASDLTLQAESGALKFKGPRDREPVVAGGLVSEFFGGLFAAPPALAAVLRALRTGVGEVIDVSIHDVLAVAGSNLVQVIHDIIGRPPFTAPARWLDTPGIERASDGLVAFNTNAAHMFQTFLLMVERPDLMDDPKIASAAHRLGMGDEWQRIIDAFVGSHTVDEVIDAAVALRVPVAHVHDGRSILTDEHVVARGVFRQDSDGFTWPRPPYQIDGRELATTRRPADQPRAKPPRPAAPAHEPGLPLAGLKVVDLTSWWVGALSTQTLAMLGADVIHIEGVAHPDGMRLTGVTYARTEDWWEWGHMFAAVNTNKRGLTLDLGTDEGRSLLWRLIEWGDVLVENFAPRVAESWGLTREEVLRRNPNIVYQRMPAYGLTGPWRDRPAFAQTIEPMSTMASITGFPDALPMSKGGIPDPTGGTHGAWAILVGLAERARRGSGVFVEATMLEAALNVCAQPALEYSAYGTVMQRLGNRAAHAAPQGVYAAAGADEWLAISVLDDAQWQALAGVISADPKLDAAQRHACHDELDQKIGEWCAGRDPVVAAAELRSLGIPAAACRDPRDIDTHPQYEARSLYEPVDHPTLGRHYVPGLPVRFRTVDHWLRRAAPSYGQHNEEVLRDVLGLDDESIRRLESSGVIASRPRGL